MRHATVRLGSYTAHTGQWTAAVRAVAKPKRVVAGWRLERLLGSGGMASVYAATDARGRVGAVKLLHPSLARDPDVRARFLREGHLANLVAHPGAVRILDVCEGDDGAALLVMELLEGETLEARADRAGGTLPVAEVLARIDELLDVLATAHARGIVHRDLKPDNLFVTGDGRLKVLDFGIARLAGAATEATLTGLLMGTPSFMAPEQVRGRSCDVDARCDLWAAGAIAFTLLAGRCVHERECAADLLVATAGEQAPSLATVAPHVPVAVAAVVDRALRLDPSERWQDARGMQEALREARRSIAVDSGARAVSACASWADADDDLAFAATHDGSDDDVTWFSRTGEVPVAREAAADSTLAAAWSPRGAPAVAREAASARPPVSTRWPAVALAATTAIFAVAGKVAVLCLLAAHLGP